MAKRISRRRRKFAARRIRPVAVHRYHHMWVRQWRVQRRELAFCLEASDFVDQVRDGFMRLTLRVGKRKLTYVFSRAEVGELLRKFEAHLAHLQEGARVFAWVVVGDDVCEVITQLVDALQRGALHG